LVELVVFVSKSGEGAEEEVATPREFHDVR
jgi:hypothetical protein